MIMATNTTCPGTTESRAMRWRDLAAAMLGLGLIGWLALWAWRALQLWSANHACVLVAGPFLPCGPGPLAWQKPLIVALLPAALLGLTCALGCILRTVRPALQGRPPRRGRAGH